ncbi:MAG: hypothetical protein HQ559_13150 [Lentisphaerae bacterium]|nr:hypothetical protein [Lentisphaerota bacterium]
MAKDKRRITQNRAKKKARDEARKKRKKQQDARGGSGRFAHMGCARGELERSPIHAAYVGGSILTQGIGHAIIARELPDGRIAAGVFLVDVYCLGVKNAFLMVQSPFEFAAVIETRFDVNDLKPASPAYARKLVDDSIAYARDLGFEPHRDFRDASVVLGDIDPAECSERFTFGHDGKPLYISGPHDSESMIRRVTAQLRNRCGPDGAHYLVGMTDPSIADSLGLDGRIVREDGEEVGD